MENSLILGLALGAFLIFRMVSLSTNKNVKQLSTEEAHELIESTKGLLIIDLRTDQEFNEAHIPGSKSMPINQFASRISEITSYKDKPVLVHCASGGNSPVAVRALLKHDFSNIYHLKRGLIGWKYGLE
jgi:rhodanese-related sulfurtransferase